MPDLSKGIHYYNLHVKGCYCFVKEIADFFMHPLNHIAWSCEKEMEILSTISNVPSHKSNVFFPNSWTNGADFDVLL